jgi:sulfite reductase (NADPH) hemoprotein beta-component
VHRDFGDRTNRRHARLKFVLAEKGVDWFRAEVERRAGFSLEPARPFTFTSQGDLYGWHRQAGGRWFLGLFVETGRIKDLPGRALKSALRRVAERFQPELRLTPSQNLLFTNVPEADIAGINALLAEHGIAVERQAGASRSVSLACPALPTCGLALAESERVFPALLDRLESALTEVGLGDEGIIVRMTGCPNGCARSQLAEIGVIGRGPGKYNLHLGGDAVGTRLNRLWRESVKFDDLVGELRPVLARFAVERRTGERFGDFCMRAVLN